jgi:hypothetical protein
MRGGMTSMESEAFGGQLSKEHRGDKRGDFEIERRIRISRHNECNMRVQYESSTSEFNLSSTSEFNLIG